MAKKGSGKRRGFAVMNPKRQMEIARKGGLSGGAGRGWFGNKQGHAQAGSKGGRRTAQIYGIDFYRKIGSTGGRT